MQASLTDRTGWPWWLAAALVAVLMAMWWRPWVADTVVPAPAPAATIVKRMPASEPGSPLPAPTQAVARAPALKLVGTVVDGAGSFATVRRTTDSQLLLLRVGDRIDGLAVVAVEPDRIVLAGAAQPPIVIEVDRTAAVPAPPVPSRAVSALPASQAQPAFAEGEAPWDAGPDFRH